MFSLAIATIVKNFPLISAVRHILVLVSLSVMSHRNGDFITDLAVDYYCGNNMSYHDRATMHFCYQHINMSLCTICIIGMLIYVNNHLSLVDYGYSR